MREWTSIFPLDQACCSLWKWQNCPSFWSPGSLLEYNQTSQSFRKSPMIYWQKRQWSPSSLAFYLKFCREFKRIKGALFALCILFVTDIHSEMCGKTLIYCDIFGKSALERDIALKTNIVSHFSQVSLLETQPHVWRLYTHNTSLVAEEFLTPQRGLLTLWLWIWRLRSRHRYRAWLHHCHAHNRSKRTPSRVLLPQYSQLDSLSQFIRGDEFKWVRLIWVAV